MSQGWSTHLPHFLDEMGNIPELPPHACRVAKALCAFVAYATHFDDAKDKMPPCFAVINKKRCRGKVQALLSPSDDTIVWECERCKNWGAISGWQGTLWDLTKNCK